MVSRVVREKDMMEESMLPDTTTEPSGSMDTLLTPPVCWSMMASVLPAAVSLAGRGGGGQGLGS